MGTPSKYLFIGNLPDNTTEDEIKELLKEYTTISSIKLKEKYGFVTCENEEGAKKAEDKSQETQDAFKIRDTIVNIEYTKQKTKRCYICGKTSHLARDCPRFVSCNPLMLLMSE